MSLSLDDYFEKEGYQCPLCFEVFDYKGNSNKNPTRVNVSEEVECIDYVCMQCFPAISKQMNNKCPVCRVTVKGRVNVIKDRVKIQMMEQAEKTWNALYGARPNQGAVSSAAVAPMQVVPAAPVIEIPQNFKLDQIIKSSININDHSRSLEQVFDRVATKMGWGLKDLREEFRGTPHVPGSPQDWVSMHLSGPDRSIQGFAWLQPKTAGQYEIHWSGVLGNFDDQFWYLFSNLMQEIRAETENLSNKEAVTATYYFRNGDELEQFNRHVGFVMRSGLNFEVIKINSGKRQLRIYPWHFVGDKMDLETPAYINSYKRLKREGDQNIERALSGPLALRTLFKMTNFQSEADANALITAFQANPDQFLIYSLNGKAEGYLKVGNVTIEKMGMYPQSKKFLKHFIQQFLTNSTAAHFSYFFQYGKADELATALIQVAEHLSLPFKTGMVSHSSNCELLIQLKK